MSEMERELAELKREVVEARNQAIKTDNQVKNLSLDVKGFEKRFDGIEKRARLGGVTVNVIIAFTIAVAAYAVNAVRAKNHREVVAKMQAEATHNTQVAEAKMQDLRERLSGAQQERKDRMEASRLAREILGHLDAREEDKAGEVFEQLVMGRLSGLERELTERRLLDFRRKLGDSAYKAGRSLLHAGKDQNAVAELRRSLRLEPEGRYAQSARYLLATTLWNSKRYEEAAPVLSKIRELETDRAVLEEARYLLATSKAHLGQRDEARRLFHEVVNAGGRYGGSARVYIAALESGGELPADLPGGRVARGGNHIATP